MGFKMQNQNLAYWGILSKKQAKLKEHLDHVSIGTWDQQGWMSGFGIKLQRNKLACFGQFQQGKISDNNSFFFGEDESIQKGQMYNGLFQGKSIKVDRDGYFFDGVWNQDTLHQKS